MPIIVIADILKLRWHVGGGKEKAQKMGRVGD